MAKKEKKISIRAMDEVLRRNYQPVVQDEWNDVEVTIKRTLSFKEMLEFVNDVVMSCFREDGSFMPEVRDFVMRSNILTRYANFSLPDNLEHRYELVYCTDAEELVRRYINEMQINEIERAIDRKLQELCRSNAIGIQRQMSQLLANLDEAQQKAEQMIGSVTKEDLEKLIMAIGNGVVDEEKLVQAYMNQKPAETE